MTRFVRLDRGWLVATLCLIATCAAASPALATQQQPPNSVGVRLIDADRGLDDGRSMSAIVARVAPGDEIARRVEIVSTVDRPLEVRVYGGNATISEGVFRPDDSSGAPGSWISVDDPAPRLEPMARREVVASIEVPDDVADGEYFGVLWVEPPAGGEGIEVVNRVGIRLYLSIGEGEAPQVDFELGSMIAGRDSGGQAYVDLDVVNSGGRSVDLGGEMRLSEGPGGISAGPVPADAPVSLLPGESATLRFSFDAGLPDGPWLARAEVGSGVLKKAAEAVVTFPGEAGITSAPASSEEVPLIRDRGFLLPLALGLLLLAMFLVFLVWWFARRRRDEDEDATEPDVVGV